MGQGKGVASERCSCQVTKADRARGDIDVIKCRLCSAIVSAFGRTLCGTLWHREDGPAEDFVLRPPRDFFACSGSLERHCEQPSHSSAWSLVCNRVHGDRALGRSWFIFIVIELLVPQGPCQKRSKKSIQRRRGSMRSCHGEVGMLPGNR